MYDELIQEHKGQSSDGRGVREVVELVQDLPPMPDVITRALQLVDDPDATMEELAAVILRDPALVSTLMRMAKSAGAGRETPVLTLAEAVQVLGMKRVKMVLLAAGLRRWNRRFGPLERLMWEKSLGTAAAARVLCERLEKRYGDELYLGGLLHNLGQIVFLFDKQLSLLYPKVLDRIRLRQEDFVAAEQNIFGFSHPLVGALVARKWGLPYSTCQVILHYAEPFAGITGELEEKVGLLKLASELALAAGIGCPEGYTLNEPSLVSLMHAFGYPCAGDGSADLEQAKNDTKTRFAAEVASYS